MKKEFVMKVESEKGSKGVFIHRFTGGFKVVANPLAKHNIIGDTRKDLLTPVLGLPFSWPVRSLIALCEVISGVRRSRFNWSNYVESHHTVYAE
jgi:hypothetical protein